jgi:hypothetical protein
VGNARLVSVVQSKQFDLTAALGGYTQAIRQIPDERGIDTGSPISHLELWFGNASVKEAKLVVTQFFNNAATFKRIDEPVYDTAAQPRSRDYLALGQDFPWRLKGC